MKEGTSLKKITSVNAIKFNQKDSLYMCLDDMQNFVRKFGDIFNCVYNNLKTGPIDIYGINYLKKEDIPQIINSLNQKSIFGYERLLAWLEEAQKHNGFYILGI